jgi:hypothetical protein
VLALRVIDHRSRCEQVCEGGRAQSGLVECSGAKHPMLGGQEWAGVAGGSGVTPENLAQAARKRATNT